jgi:hypothetical protein
MKEPTHPGAAALSRGHVEQCSFSYSQPMGFTSRSCFIPTCVAQSRRAERGFLFPRWPAGNQGVEGGRRPEPFIPWSTGSHVNAASQEQGLQHRREDEWRA